MKLFQRNSRRYKYSGAKRRRKSAQQIKADSDIQSFVLFIVLLGTLVWFCAAATILYQRAYPSYQYVVGQIADRDIYSEVPFQFADEKETSRLRQKAEEQIPLAFFIDGRSVEDILRRLGELREKILAAAEADATAETGGKDETGRVSNADIAEVQKTPSTAVEGIDSKTLQPLAAILDEPRKWKALQSISERVLMQGVRIPDVEKMFAGESAPSDRILLLLPTQSRSSIRKLSDIPTVQEAVDMIVGEFAVSFAGTSPSDSQAVRQFIASELVSNLTFAADVTEERRDNAAKRVEPVTKSVGVGVRLLQRGEKVTSVHIEQLKTHSVELQADLKQRHGTRRAVIISMLVLVLVLGFGRGLIGFNRESLATRRNALLIATIVIIQIILVRVIADLLHLQGFPAIILNSALPLALGSVLLAQLVGFRVAVWSCVFTSMIAALQLEQWSFKVLLSGLIAGFVGAVLVRQARRRTHVFRAGLWIGVATFLTSTLFYLGTDVPYGYLAQIAAVSLLNGLGTAIFTSTILPLLEFLFGVTTDISLLELSDLNHPLLKRLQIEAPGTFHHSLVVATLAEQAAAAIGANPLLARVCAYFHDIGKISQPEYFTENNMANGGRDAHNNLQPRMSSLIILNHVKEGLELAADYKLNKTLREAIAQHHGTSLIYYFYRRAVDQKTDNDKEDGEVGQQDYRYPGPRGRKKEIVLIGLADACEAAVRALEKPTPQKIQALVGEIVMQRVQDGQLDEANLTFRELAVAKDTLIKALSNMFHGRVPYPKDKEKSKQDEDSPDNADGNGDADKPE